MLDEALWCGTIVVSAKLAVISYDARYSSWSCLRLNDGIDFSPDSVK